MGSMSAADDARALVFAKHLCAAFEELGFDDVKAEPFDAGNAVGVLAGGAVTMSRIQKHEAPV